jgi:hypothetical protein
MVEYHQTLVMITSLDILTHIKFDKNLGNIKRTTNFCENSGRKNTNAKKEKGVE